MQPLEAVQPGDPGLRHPAALIRAALLEARAAGGAGPGCRPPSPAAARGAARLRSYGAEIVDETDHGPEIDGAGRRDVWTWRAGPCPA